MYGLSLSCSFRWEWECSVKDWFFLVYSNTRPVRSVLQELVWLYILQRKVLLLNAFIFFYENIVKKLVNFLEDTLFLHCRLANGKNCFMKVMLCASY